MNFKGHEREAPVESGHAGDPERVREDEDGDDGQAGSGSGGGAMTTSLDAMTLPSWAAHVDFKAAPMPLLRVQAFVDTLDIDLRTDVLADAEQARAWLSAAGLRDSRPDEADWPGPDFGDDLRLARAARESIRALIGRDAGTGPLTPAQLEPLETALRDAQPRLEVAADGRVLLRPAFAAEVPARLADGILGLLLIIRDAQADGSWDRLKLCGNPDCQWAFYDRSHSRRGAWCDMASCGNRLKNRNLRARRRPAGPTGPAEPAEPAGLAEPAG
jgi:predicted RNA-binding Zn ribbon-like protein